MLATCWGTGLLQLANGSHARNLPHGVSAGAGLEQAETEMAGSSMPHGRSGVWNVARHSSKRSAQLRDGRVYSAAAQRGIACSNV